MAPSCKTNLRFFCIVFLTYAASNGLQAEINPQIDTFDMVIIGHAVQNCSSGLHTYTLALWVTICLGFIVKNEAEAKSLLGCLLPKALGVQPC